MKRTVTLAFNLSFLFFVLAFNKINAQITPPTVTTDSVNTITGTTATANGTVTNNGGDPNVTDGFCYSTAPNPTIADSTTAGGSVVTGGYAFWISNLSQNTTYYVRAYATDSAGTTYGSQLQFTTGAATLPTVTTDSVNSLTATSVVIYGNVTNIGNDPGINETMCFSTSPNPTLANSIKVVWGGGGGLFSDSISNLIPNTTYYVRAVAKNAAGTVYGNQLQFTTLAAAFVKSSVTSDSVNNIGATSAAVFGSLTLSPADTAGNNYVGFCQSTSPNPTFPNDTTVFVKNDSAILINSSSQPYYFYYYGTLYNLAPNTTYYIRAVISTTAGVSYGDQLQFTTGEGDCFAYYSTSYDTVQNKFTLTVDPRTGAVAKSYLWNFGDGTTSTNPAPSHTYAANGIYNVCMKITVASGDSCTYCHSIGKDSLGNIYRTAGFWMTVQNKEVTGVESINATTNYSVFPNPATDGKSTVLFGKLLTNAIIRVTSITGIKVVEMSNYSGSQIQLDISNQAAGVYIIEVVDDGEVYRTKLIKD